MSQAPLMVILAAGLGTRMRSATPKVLHTVGGLALIDHVIATVEAAGGTPIVVLNPAHADVAAHVRGRAQTVEQVSPRGTGDALRSVPHSLRGHGPVVVLNGDVPLIRPETVRRLLAALDDGHGGALLTVPGTPGNGLGRVHRNAGGDVEAIVEERDLVPGAFEGNECNAGIYAFSGTALWPALEQLTTANAQGEYYLTDVVGLLGAPVAALLSDDPAEGIGINDRRDLAAAEAALRARTLDSLMRGGVTIVDPATTIVDRGVEIGADSVIEPFTVIRGVTRLGGGCRLGPGAQLRDVQGGDRVRVGTSVIEEAELGDDVSIGHFNRIRPNTKLAAGVSLGTHAEVKNSTIGAGSRVNHFSCVLDSDVGSDVNIGAGTVTCNFDGAAKHRTRIGDRTFVGTNSTLVAPLTIAAGSYVAAGSVITQDVPDGALAVGRARQRNVLGWVARRARGASSSRETA